MNRFHLESGWPMRRLGGLAMLCGVAALTACGGAGGAGDDPLDDGPTYLTFAGNSNGSVVLAANDFQVRFYSDGDMSYDGKDFANTVVDPGTGVVTLDGSPVAYVELADGSNGSQVAVLDCVSDPAVRVTINETTYTLTCPAGASATAVPRSRPGAGAR